MTGELDLDRYDEATRRMLAAMTAAEDQMLQEARKSGNSYLTDVTRRHILRGSVAVAGSAAALSLAICGLAVLRQPSDRFQTERQWAWRGPFRSGR